MLKADAGFSRICVKLAEMADVSVVTRKTWTTWKAK